MASKTSGSATADGTAATSWENELIEDEIVLRIEDERNNIETQDDAALFIRKYGEIEYHYIERPKDSVWFIKPHALNYFKDGVLYRTKGERTSAKTELFLDLMYVGIIANLASAVAEDPTGLSLLKYVLFFVPAWTVWSDIKDFTNHYYNEDLSQKIYIAWILALLTLFVNSHGYFHELTGNAAYTIVPYILCRFSLAVSLVIYSFYIPEHRPQQRLYAAFITFTCCLWIPVIFIPVRAQIGLSIFIMVLENVLFVLSYHPLVKRMMKLTTSTAVNIEHEVERFATFVTIAIGEFLYKIVATGPLGAGLSDKFGRGIFLLIIAYVLFWIYHNGSTAQCATHAMRRSVTTGIIWIYAHLPLVASLVLAADVGGDIVALDHTRLSKRLEVGGESIPSEEEPNMYAMSLFFTGSLCVALLSLTVLGFMDKSKDPPDLFVIPRFWRVIFRAPIGIIILCLSFAELTSTLMMGIITILLLILLVFESVTSTPKICLLKEPREISTHE